MSHDPANKNCPRHGQYAAKSECTCPPADEVEQIRARHNSTLFINWGFSSDAQPHSLANAEQCHADREALLRIVDQQASELHKLRLCRKELAEITQAIQDPGVNLVTTAVTAIECLYADLAAANAEIERLRTERDKHKTNAAFYKCCALAGEVPTAGEEPHPNLTKLNWEQPK